MPPPKVNVTNQLFLTALIQAVAYMLLWLSNEYVAFYVTVIFPAMIFFILILARIADWIEPSRIPGWYYKVMLISIAIPVIIGFIFYFLHDGKFEFLSQ